MGVKQSVRYMELFHPTDQLFKICLSLDQSPPDSLLDRGVIIVWPFETDRFAR